MGTTFSEEYQETIGTFQANRMIKDGNQVLRRTVEGADVFNLVRGRLRNDMKLPPNS